MAEKKKYDLETVAGALDAWRDSREGFQTEYSDPYAAEKAGLRDQLKTEKFKYDPGADSDYQALAARYRRNAQNSMNDTLARATSLTAGMNNSWAQQAAQQAYDARMGELDERLSEMEDRAYSRWRDELGDKYNYYGLLNGESETGYGRWADSERFKRDDADQLLNLWQGNRDYEHQKEREGVEDLWRQKEFDEGVRQFNVQQASKNAAGGSSSSSSASSGAKYADMKSYSSAIKGKDPQTVYNFVVGTLYGGGYVNEAQAEQLLMEYGVTDLASFINKYGRDPALYEELARQNGGGVSSGGGGGGRRVNMTR